MGRGTKNLIALAASAAPFAVAAFVTLQWNPAHWDEPTRMIVSLFAIFFGPMMRLALADIE